MLKNRSEFFFEVASGPFFGFNRKGVKKNDAMIQDWWNQGMLTGLKAAHDCVATWEKDMTEDLKKMDVPVLLLHGTDDQVVPIDASARAAVKLLSNGKLIEFPGGAHGLPNTEADWVNDHLLKWLKA